MNNSHGKLLLQLILAFAFGVCLTMLSCTTLEKQFDAFLFVCMFGIGCLIMIFWRIIEYRIHKQYEYTPNHTIKIGIDIHGMIDHDPKFFSELSRSLCYSGHEVHIMTGSHITSEIENELKNYGMRWTKLFSIADYYKNKPGVKMWYDDKNRPWVNSELWNMAKANYAEENNLDITLDDTSDYQEYFTTSIGICKIVNKAGKVRPPKAKMPIQNNNHKQENYNTSEKLTKDN